MIDTPPPTVSGSLHIGHIFSYTQTDIIARYQRMQGKSVFYPIGWDDNGLPTERRVQNYYNIACNPKVAYDPAFKPVHVENAKDERKEISRKNFIEACETLTAEDEKIFENVFRRIGHSYDWNLTYSTISPSSIKISQASFLDLYKKGKVVAVEAPIMWDVTFKSAVSQAEVEDKEMEGFFHDIRFSVKDSDETFTIATTRPELLAACLAIVAHPDDERYKHLFGKTAVVPLFDIPVPIVPSEHAEKDKGTGIMMVCTFGDAADVAWWKKSGLPIKQIIGLDGKIMNITYGEGVFNTLNKEEAQKNFSQIIGLPAHIAKKKVAEMLKEQGYLIGEPKKIVHPVKFYEKGNLPLEFVSSRQWFVNLMDMKQEMLAAGRKIEWLPAYMQHRYETWTEGLNQDWCISRQRYFGVPFPVWYKVDANGNIDYNQVILPEENRLPIDPMADTPTGYAESQRNQPNGFAGDPDVMDTWATSSLTPQIAMAMAKDGSNLSMPFDIRPQAHDIIRTWAFYTIAKSLMHENTIPWHKTLISGFILDPDRKKMSKSKGNVLYADDLVDFFGVDAVRYFVLHEMPFENDGVISWELMVERLNSDLANTLGNLVNRTISMSNKYFGGVVADKGAAEAVDEDLKAVVTGTYDKVAAKMEGWRVADAITDIFTLFKRCNKYIDETEPWVLAKDPAKADRLATVLYNLTESIVIGASLLEPYMPGTVEKIAAQLNTSLRSFEECTTFGGYISGSKVTEKPEILFARLDVKEVLEKAAAMFEARKALTEEAEEEKEEDVMELTKKPEITFEEFEKMQFAVGEIIKCEPVPKSKKLLCSQVKIGKEVKQIVSGIRAHYTAEEMVGKKVMVLVNLKPAKLAGVLSEGMLLCAEDENGTLSLMTPEKPMPSGAEIC